MGKLLKQFFTEYKALFFWQEMNPEVGLPKETIRDRDSPLETKIRKELEMEIRRAR